MKLRRLWGIIIGRDDELSEMKKRHEEAQQSLHESTQRLVEATEELSERTIRIVAEDKKSQDQLSELERVARHG